MNDKMVPFGDVSPAVRPKVDEKEALEARIIIISLVTSNASSIHASSMATVV